ncbi:MAG: serine/threonine protein kinase [Polyangiaceae bacterium]|nr:serine/threonine protein kinase [Polyangiaceae bacterium]
MANDVPRSGINSTLDALPPTVHGRYVPLSVVGEGSSTTVYRAYDVFADRDVALQILRSDPELEPIRRRFLSATRAVIEIRHRAVVTCLDAGETETGDPYAVMELLEGQTLGDYLGRVGRIPWTEAMPLFLEAAAGLGAIHAAGLVHRDVKPDNLFLLGPVDAPKHVKILDFGLLTRMEGSSEAVQEWVVGTTEYMPPEQVLCDPVDARSDIYSLGAVLFRALTGELPFAEVPRNRVLAHHLVSPAPPASWLVDDLPPGLSAIISTALRKDPENRFATVRAVREALERVALGSLPAFEAPPLTHAPDRYEPRGEASSAALRALGGSLAA